MKTKSAYRLVRTGTRAAYLLAVSIASLLATSHSRADITLDGTPLSYSGTASGTSSPGINGSFFTGTNSGSINLDNATYTVETTRAFSGTQGVLGMTPASSVVLYTGEVSGFSMLSGAGGDSFSTAFSGTFTPATTGDHTFRWDNDDRGAMYIDMNADGVFQSSERVGNIEWHGSGTKTLTAGIAYNYIYMTGEDGGGESNNWWITLPGGSEMRVNPSNSAQLGMWNVGSISYGPLSFAGQNLNVNANTPLELRSGSNVDFALLNANAGTATITGVLPSLSFTGTNVAASASSGIATTASTTLGPVVIGDGGTLLATGSGTMTATSITLSGSTGGITANGTFNLGTYSDGGSTKTLTLGGTGTKVMDNSAGGIVASNTTLRVTGGTLDATNSGSNDPLGGATAIQLAGGKLSMSGQVSTISNALKASYYTGLGDARGYIEFGSGYDLRYQTPVATATETGAIWYRSNGSEGKKYWSDLFAGQSNSGQFDVMWQGQYKPTTTSNKILGTWESDNDWEAYVKIGGNWERWRDSWRTLDSANWYDMAITYKNNADDYGSIHIPMHQSYQDWTGLDVASGNSFGQFRFQSIGAVDMSGKTLRVDANSELAVATDSPLSVGALTLANGVLTVSGAPSTTFASTAIDAAATSVGINSGASVALGVITGNSATGTFVKAGAGTLTLNNGNTGLSNMMFDVQGGKLLAPTPASLGGAASVQLSGGALSLSRGISGGSTFDVAMDVTQNATLAVGKTVEGVSFPSVTLGSDTKTLTVRNGKTLTVNTADGYGLTIRDGLVLEDNATMTVNGSDANGLVNILNTGAASLTMGGNSTLTLNAGSLTTDKALTVYNLNLAGGGLSQTGTGAAKDLTVNGTLTLNSSSTNLDLSGATLATASNATLNLVNGIITTDSALTVGNLTVESGATLNLTGIGVNRNINVGDKLRLVGKTLDTTGSTLSVGNRIELENSSLTSGNALTVNSLWMSNSTISSPSLTVNGTIELYNGSSANYTGKTLAVGGIRMDNNATLTYDQAMTINGQIEIYSNSKVDLGSNVLTTNWQNLYVQGGSSELKAGGNLNINYLQMDGSGKLSVPSVTLNDRFHLRSTDSRYGNNVENFSILENPSNPGRYVDIYGGGFDRNPNDGSSDLYFNGTNTYTGRTQIMDATVLVANDGVGMPTGSYVRFENGVWGASGTITRTIGENNTGGGKVFWGNWGGFAAYGGALTVTLTPDGGASGDKLYWNSGTQGFREQGLYLGSSNATHNVTLTNPIEVNSYARISTQSKTTLATLSGNLTGSSEMEKQGPGTLMLGGDNSAYTGNMYIHRGVLDVGTDLAGLGTGAVVLRADTDDPYWKGAILQASGTLNKTIGWYEAGKLSWDWSGGGFAARGGALNVTLATGVMGTQILWGSSTDGFNGRRLMFGSGTADNVVTLTNNIDAQNDYRYIYAFDNPNSANDKAVLSGTVVNLRGLEKRGDGRLEMNGFATSGDQVRIYDGGTLKVIGNLQAGDLDPSTDPRYVGTSYNNVENSDGKLIVTGNVQASSYYGGNTVSSSNDISGNLTLRNHFEQNEGTAHIGGNLQTGEDWIGVRNTTVLTVDGNIRSGAPNGSAADRDLYSWGGGRMVVGGNVAANRLYFEQGKASNGQLPGITVAGTVNVQDGLDMRTGSSTFNNVNAPNYVVARYGADLTINGNLVTNSLEASEWDYWYGTGRTSNLHLNGTANINSGNGNIGINANNPGTGYGVFDGTGTASAGNVYLDNKAMLAGTLTLNVSGGDGVRLSGNSVLAPGGVGAGTLTIGKIGGNGGNLTLNGSTLYVFDGGDKVNVAGQLTLNDNWTLGLLATGQRLAAGGTLTLFNYGTLGTFDDTPTYDVSALIAAGWLDAGFDTGTLSVTSTGSSIVLNGISLRPPMWTGLGSDNKWTTTNNWDLAAAAGATLQFAGVVNTSTSNDFAAGTAFSGLVFNADAGSFTLAGNSINLNGDIVNNSSNAQTLSLPMVVSPTTTVNTGAQAMLISGDLSGTGGWLTKTGAGTLTLSGTNTQTGGTAINEGTVAIASGTTLGAAVKFAGGTLSTTAALSSAAALNVTSAGGTLNDNGHDLTFSGVNTGTGTLTKSGAGTLTLSGASSNLTGTIALTGGKLVATAASLAGPVAMTNNTNVTFNQTTDGSYDKAISGAGSLTKSGAAALSLSAAQTYTGGTTIANGTLKLNGEAPRINVHFSSTASPSSYTGAGAIGNASDAWNYAMFSDGWDNSLKPTNMALTTSTGAATSALFSYTGGQFCMVPWGNGSNTLTGYDYLGMWGGGPGNQNVTFTGLASGTYDVYAYGFNSVDFTFNGNAASLDGTNNQNASGINLGKNYVVRTVTVTDGTLAVTANGNGGYDALQLQRTDIGGSNLLPTDSVVTMASNTTLDVNGNIQQIARFDDTGATGHQVLLGTGTLTVGDATDSTFSGAISGVGGTLVKAGSGKLTLASLSTNAGLTVAEGKLDLGGTTATISGQITFQGGTTQNGIITNNGTAYAGKAGLVTASLQGTAGLNKTTSGELVLNGGTNTYSGATSITGGTLRVVGSLPNSAITVAGGHLATGADASTVATFTAANLTLTSGSIDFKFGSSTNDLFHITGTDALTLSAPGGISLYQAGGTTTFNSNGSYDLFEYTGADIAASPSLILNRTGGKTYSFSTVVAGSNKFLHLDIATSSARPTWIGAGGDTNWSTGENWDAVAGSPLGSESILFAATSGNLTSNNDIAGRSYANFEFGTGFEAPEAQVASHTLTGEGVTLTGSAGNIIRNNSTNLQTVNLPITLGAAGQIETANGPIAIGGTIDNAGHTLSFAGTSTTSVSGAIIGTGNTAVNSGTLEISGAGTIGTAGVYTGNIAISTGATFKYNSSASVELTGLISGAGDITKSGAGVLTLSHANTYTGTTNVKFGTEYSVIRAGDDLAFGPASTAKLQFFAPPGGHNRAIVELYGHNVTVASLEGPAGNDWGEGAINAYPQASGNTLINGASSGTATLTVNNSVDNFYGGGMRDGGDGTLALVKDGTGKLTLYPHNTYIGYSGGTTVKNGTFAGGVFGYGGLTFNVGTGNTGLVQLMGYSPAALPSLTMDPAHLGTAIIENGGTGNSTLYINNASANTYSGTLQDGAGGGKLALTKYGAGTLTLGGPLSLTGEVYVNSGTLRFTSNNQFTNAPALVLGGGNLGGGGLATADLNDTDQTVGGIIFAEGSGNSDVALTTGLGTLTITGTKLTNGNAAIGGALQSDFAKSISGKINLNGGDIGINNYAWNLSNKDLGMLTISAAMSNGAITLSDAVEAPVMFSGASTYAGGTTLKNANSNGTLRIGSDSVGTVGAITSGPLGTGTVTFNNGRLSSDGTTARTILNPVAFVNDRNAILGSATNTGKLTFGAGADLGGTNHTLTVNSDVQFNGAVTGTATATVNGAGRLLLGQGGSMAPAVIVDSPATYGLRQTSSSLTPISGGASLALANGTTLDLQDAHTNTLAISGVGTLSGASLYFDLGTTVGDQLTIGGAATTSAGTLGNVFTFNQLGGSLKTGTAAYTLVSANGGLSVGNFGLNSSALGDYTLTLGGDTNSIWLNVSGGGVITGNNSQILIGSADNSNTGTGASDKTIGFGRVLLSSTQTTGSQSIANSGTDSATYTVTPNSDVASTTFASGTLATGSTNGTITLNTATVGSKSGTLTIANTSADSAAAGLGSADADDVFTVTGSVVDQRSFNVGTPTLVLGTIHAGTVAAGSTTAITSLGLNAVTANASLGSFSGTNTGSLTLTTSDSTAFNGATTQTATYALGGTITAGNLSSASFSSTVSAELGSISNVVVNVTGSATNGLATWAASGNGNWSVNGDWTDTAGVNAAPGTFGASYAGMDTATFGAGGHTVTVDTAANLNLLTFTGASNYTLASGAGSLTLAGTAAGINVTSGTQAINASLNLAANAAVGVTAGSLTIGGNISAAGSQTLTKNGGGILTLSGTNDYGGNTHVVDGALYINGANTGLGTVTVDATLGGSGSIAGAVHVTGTGYLSPGLGSASYESLASGALTLDSGSRLVMEALNGTSTGADLMVVGGDLTLTSPTLDLTGLSGAWAAGSRLTLLSYPTGGLTGTFSGYADDTSYLFGSNYWMINYNAPLADKGSNFASEVPSSGAQLVTVTLDAYKTWASAASFSTDSNNDGVANGLAWILGATNTSANANALLPTASASAGGGLTLTFKRLEASIGQSTLVLEYSTSLTSNSWTPVTIGATSSSSDGVVITVNQASPSDTVSVNIPASKAAPGGKVFARLKATQP